MNMLRHPITKKDEEDEEGSEGRRRKVEKNAQLNKVKWHEGQWQDVYVSVCFSGFTVKACAFCRSQLSCTISKIYAVFQINLYCVIMGENDDIYIDSTTDYQIFVVMETKMTIKQ